MLGLVSLQTYVSVHGRCSKASASFLVIKIILGVHLLTYATRRRAGMEVREEADRPVRGVVFMGMGEPLLNYTETIRAAQILSNPAGFAISGTAITFSTAGMVPAIRRYTSEGHPYRLAFSVTSEDSWAVSLRRMARVFLDRRSRGWYLQPC